MSDAHKYTDKRLRELDATAVLLRQTQLELDDWKRRALAAEAEVDRMHDARVAHEAQDERDAKVRRGRGQ